MAAVDLCLSTQEKMKSALSSLQDKKEAFETMKKNYEDTATYIQVRSVPQSSAVSKSGSPEDAAFCVWVQVQARFVETQTHLEFEKLRSFLCAEEETRIQALKREEELRSRAMAEKIEEITRDIASVSEHIRALEEELASDGISVLHVRLKHPASPAIAATPTFQMIHALISFFSFSQKCKKTLARSSKLTNTTFSWLFFFFFTCMWICNRFDLLLTEPTLQSQSRPCTPER